MHTYVRLLWHACRKFVTSCCKLAVSMSIYLACLPHVRQLCSGNFVTILLACCKLVTFPASLSPTSHFSCKLALRSSLIRQACRKLVTHLFPGSLPQAHHLSGKLVANFSLFLQACLKLVIYPASLSQTSHFSGKLAVSLSLIRQISRKLVTYPAGLSRTRHFFR